MAMRLIYPFDYDFSGYSDERLFAAAQELHMWDREDLQNLTQELAKRLKEVYDKIDSS